MVVVVPYLAYPIEDHTGFIIGGACRPLRKSIAGGLSGSGEADPGITHLLFKKFGDTFFDTDRYQIGIMKYVGDFGAVPCNCMVLF